MKAELLEPMVKDALGPVLKIVIRREKQQEIKEI